MTDHNTNLPVEKLGYGLIKCAIWENIPTDPDKKPYFTTTFSRSYQDDQGNWQDTQSFGLNDLLPLSKLADQAHTAIHNRMRANNGNARPVQTDRGR